MVNFREFDRSPAFLLPPDLRKWVPADDLADFVVEAVERVEIGAFKVNWGCSGKRQYHPRLMLALLIYCYANGIFSSRRIERATYRDIAVRFIAANAHPDHDTIATFRRENAMAIKAAFVQVLLLARKLGLLRLGMVSVELDADIAELLARAEAADADASVDPETLPAEIARRRALRRELDEACVRLEAEARADAEQEQAGYEAKRRAHIERGGAGRSPSPPDPTLPAARQTNLTDSDSRLMRKSKRHEYRQGYNAQAVVDADGSQLVLATEVSQSPSDSPTFEATIRTLETTVGKPETILADPGFANGDAMAALEARQIDVLVAVTRTANRRTYDFRPPPRVEAEPPSAPKADWRIKMREKLQTEDTKEKYQRRKYTVEPVFGIIKNVLGFTRLHLRSLAKVKREWLLVTLAYNCKRLARLAAV